MELSALIARLNQPDEQERYWVVKVLTDKLRAEQTEEGVSLLSVALESNAFPLRFGAAEVLGRLGDKRAVEPLLKLRGRLHWESYEAANSALIPLAQTLARHPKNEDIPIFILLLDHLKLDLLAATVPIAGALKTLAETQPCPTLRLALPWLKQPRFARGFPPEFREAYIVIEDATKQWEDLPLPATAPSAISKKLPLPFSPLPSEPLDE